MFNTLLYSLFLAVSFSPLFIEASKFEIIQNEAPIFQKMVYRQAKRKKDLFSFSLDDAQRIVKVKNHKEKATVKFPFQEGADFETEICEEFFSVEYGKQGFGVDIDLNASDIDWQLQAFLVYCEEELEGNYSVEITKNKVILDIDAAIAIDEGVFSDDLNSSIDFDLESVSTLEQDPLFTINFRVRMIFTKKNIYHLMTIYEGEEDADLHNQLIQSFTIKS